MELTTTATRTRPTLTSFPAVCGLAAFLFMAACSTIPADIDCEGLGVRTRGNTGPMGEVLSVHRTTLGNLIKVCYGVDDVPKQYWPDGCVVPVPGGVEIYRSFADTGCTLRHEVCHARHGRYHTRRYDIAWAQGKRLC